MVKHTDARISRMIREEEKGPFEARYWANRWGVTTRRLQQLRKEFAMIAAVRHSQNRLRTNRLGYS